MVVGKFQSGDSVNAIVLAVDDKHLLATLLIHSFCEHVKVQDRENEKCAHSHNKANCVIDNYLSQTDLQLDYSNDE